MAPTNVVPLMFLGLIVWRFYRRIRRSVGRQALRRKRLITGIVIYAAVTFLLALGGLINPKVLLGLGGGLGVGVPLALFAVHLTQFETTPEGQFYTPHPYIGVSIAALLVIRLGYRMMTVMGNATQLQRPPQFAQSPLTYALFGLLAGYYIAYYAGLLIQSRRDGELNRQQS